MYFFFEENYLFLIYFDDGLLKFNIFSIHNPFFACLMNIVLYFSYYKSDYGVALPSWTSEVFPTRMAEVTAVSFVLNAYTEEMKKLKGGPLLKKILADSKDKMTKQSTHQLYAYAGHDSTLANVLSALGVWDQQIPTYNMLALLELHESNEGLFYFKVIAIRDRTVFFLCLRKYVFVRHNK